MLNKKYFNTLAETCDSQLIIFAVHLLVLEYMYCQCYVSRHVSASGIFRMQVYGDINITTTLWQRENHAYFTPVKHQRVGFQEHKAVWYNYLSIP